MFRFHNLVMKPSFDKSEICFMDTDSFLYHIHGKDIQRKLLALSEYFDFSNYKKDSQLYSIENKSKPGRLESK